MSLKLVKGSNCSYFYISLIWKKHSNCFILFLHEIIKIFKRRLIIIFKSRILHWFLFYGSSVYLQTCVIFSLNSIKSLSINSPYQRLSHWDGSRNPDDRLRQHCHFLFHGTAVVLQHLYCHSFSSCLSFSCNI